MAVGPADMAFAFLTGAAVVAVTFLADRLGGRAGGLLATAPVTTTAAHVVLVRSVAPVEAVPRVLQGGAALLAATVAILAFFYAVKFTRGHPSSVRLAAGLAAHLATFLPLTLAVASLGLPPTVTFPLFFASHVVLAATFMRVPVPVLRDYVPAAHRRGAAELLGRFAAGFVVVLLVRALVHAAPTLAGALAVVPAVFVVSLAVMGVAENAPFAARAAQAGLFGTTAVGVFVLVVAAALAADAPLAAAMLLAWAGYAATLVGLGAAHRRLLAR